MIWNAETFMAEWIRQAEERGLKPFAIGLWVRDDETHWVSLAEIAANHDPAPIIPVVLDQMQAKLRERGKPG